VVNHSSSISLIKVAEEEEEEAPEEEEEPWQLVEKEEKVEDLECN
jgi:hypothetical protein